MWRLLADVRRSTWANIAIGTAVGVIMLVVAVVGIKITARTQVGIFSSPGEALVLGILPLGAVGFLGWVLVKTLSTAPAAQVWSLISAVGAGVAVMVAVRIFLRPDFFSLPRESDASRH